MTKINSDNQIINTRDIGENAQVGKNIFRLDIGEKIAITIVTMLIIALAIYFKKDWLIAILINKL